MKLIRERDPWSKRDLRSQLNKSLFKRILAKLTTKVESLQLKR
jgi:hypothetical protein